jgi:hypothetical protein
MAAVEMAASIAVASKGPDAFAQRALDRLERPTRPWTHRRLALRALTLIAFRLEAPARPRSGPSIRLQGVKLAERSFSSGQVGPIGFTLHRGSRDAGSTPGASRTAHCPRSPTYLEAGETDAKLERGGHDATEAWRLLENLHSIQAPHIAHRDQILSELEQ